MYLPELPPQAFQFGNSGADIPFDIFMNNEKLKDYLINSVIVGIQISPEYNAREGYYAVMLALGFGEYWSHVPKEVIDKILTMPEPL